ncbi:MAG: UvrD-helicase domain-containing protein [Kiritimatiellae bacterium]|nr:UvrD-helicase domain-containing protein [Kiritimatiellia bacterium]
MSGVFAEEYARGDFGTFGRHFVEASAGTGKTYSIQSVFARLLVESSWSARPLRVGEILVVTFTNAATQELRRRLREVLETLRDAAGRLAGGCATAKDLEALRLRLGDEASGWTGERLSRARTALEAGVREFDTAAIFTIHGFCERTRIRHAFETGTSPDAELGADDSEALRDLAAAWIRSHLALAREWGVEEESFWSRYLSPLANRGDPARDTVPGAADPIPARRLELAGALLDALHDGARARKELSFNDLLRVVRDTVCDPDRGASLRSALRNEYRAVLVDEFQDTDPVQYVIFRAAFAEPGPDGESVPIYFVGDPKQAIYAFRGGDVHTYVRAKDELARAGGAEHRLGTCHRSCRGLVNAVNRLFRDAPGDPGGSAFGGGIRYESDLDASGKVKGLARGGGEEAAPFHVTLFTSCGKSDVLKQRVFAEIVRGAAGLLADERTTLDGKHLVPKDIAVLVPTNEDVAAVKHLLGKAGVRAVGEEKASVFASREARELYAALAAVESGRPGDLRAALATRLYGLGPHDLILVAKGGRARRPDGCSVGVPEAGGAAESVDFEMFQRHFAELRGLWRERGILAALQRVLADGGVRHRVERGSGERQLTNYGHLAECIHEAARAGCLAPRALVDWLRGQINDPAVSETQLRLESDDDAVKVMTIHSSKGLEFPVVFVGAMTGAASVPEWTGERLGGKSHNALRHTLGFHHHDGGLAVYARASTAPGDERNAWAEREIREEHVRLLYVALTRASSRTVLVAGATGERLVEKTTGRPTELAQLLERAGLPSGADGPDAAPVEFTDGPFAVAVRPAAAVDADSAAVGGAIPPPPGEAVSEEPPPEPPGGWKTEVRASYSSLVKHKDGDGGGGAEESERAAADMDGGTDGRPAFGESSLPIFREFRAGDKVGTAFHALFERISFQAPRAERDAQVRQILAEHGLLPSDPAAAARAAAAASEMFGRVVDLPLADPEGAPFRLADVPDADRLAEWEFVYPASARAIDLDAFGALLRRHWAGDPAKRPFLDRLGVLGGTLRPAWMKGYIDLLFRRGDRFYVVDWKSNVLDGHEDSFVQPRLLDEMARHLYFVQYLLYSAVLHAWLRRTLPGYSWERHFGGVRYVFLRGACAPGGEPGRAVVADRPSEALLDDLGRLFCLEANP